MRLTLAGATALAAAACAGAVAAQTVAPAAAGFDIDAYDVDGNTVLPQDAVEAAIYPFLGPTRTEADVNAARDALERAYHDRGYQSVVVEIPAQSVAERVIRLHVAEAAVGRLRVVGSRFHSPETIRQATPSMAEGRVPNFDTAQAELERLNRTADRRVTPIVRPGRAPGTLDVDLKVSDAFPLHVSAELNNDHSPNTESLRASATVRYDNLWQRSHTLALTYSVAPQRREDSEVFAGSYLAPAPGSAWSLLLFGYRSNSNVAAIGGALALGKGYDIGVRGIRQLPSYGGWSQSISTGFDFKHFDESLAFGSQTVGSTIDYWPLAADYTLQHQGDVSSTQVTFGAVAGSRGGLGSNEDAFANKRAFARANFAVFSIDLEHNRQLGHGVDLRLRLKGQTTDTPLVSSEQFSAGGLTSVRGYLQSEAVGDRGYLASLDLVSPPVSLAWLDEIRGFAFADYARASILEPLPDQINAQTLASLGIGARFALLRRLRGELVVGHTLQAGSTTAKGETTTTFSLKADY